MTPWLLHPSIFVRHQLNVVVTVLDSTVIRKLAVKIETHTLRECSLPLSTHDPKRASFVQSLGSLHGGRADCSTKNNRGECFGAYVLVHAVLLRL